MQKELKILLLSSGLFMLAGGLFGPIYAVFVEEIGGDLMTAGTAYGTFAIAAGILMFFVGRWEDRVKHQEKLIVIGYGLNCLGYFGYLFIRNPMDLFLVQIIFGIGKAIETPAFDGVYSKHLDHGKFVSEWGLWDSTTYIAFGISATIGGFLASIYGFKVLFVIMFVLSLFGLFISMLLMVEKKKKQIKHS
ncbi:MAG: hypothetical protein DRP06_03480 [Candidatus Aenigmatarchaeota archaeon]|nr:MAG: hypothetical protein DRP06_03480 [Candidatus Aenigmarchaeota archaeon]